MPVGSSFYIILSFKVTVGNGFQDSLLQRAITDTQAATLTHSFLACCITMFVQLSASAVTTKSELLLPFLLLCQSRQAKICMSTTFVLLEIRQASNKSCLQEWPCFFPNSTLHAKHVHNLFGLLSNSFLSSPHPPISWSQRWQPGGDCFQCASLQRLEVGFCFALFIGSIIRLCIIKQQTLFCSQTYHLSLPQTLWDWSADANLSPGGISHPPGMTACWLFSSPNPDRTLWYNDSVVPWPTHNLRFSKSCTQDLET